MTMEIERPLEKNSFGVFKPTSDPLVVRGTIGNVFDESQGMIKSTRASSKMKIRRAPKPLLSDVPPPATLPLESHLNLPSPRALQEASPRRSRPESKSSSRFGAYSQASFFSRHNPHPFRVRHISGLNGQPICAVHDHDIFPPQRFSIRTPSTRERENIFNAHIPPNALGLSSTTFPINIITGLQHYPYREKAVPRIGLIPVTDSWREELRELCQKAGLVPEIQEELPRPVSQASILPQTKRRTIYSAETGRLVPPPSRAMSRQASRQGGRPYGSYQHISAYPDTETLMLEMLCQILQTDSVHAVQQWLVSAGDREKGLVLDMIRSAMSSEEETLRRQEAERQEALAAAARAARPPTVQAQSRPHTSMSVTSRPDTMESMKPTKVQQDGAEILTLDKPATPMSPRKPTSARPLGTPSRPASRKALNDIKNASPIMRYTKTPGSVASRGRLSLPAIVEETAEVTQQDANEQPAVAS
ncbi:protein TBATA-like [Styela clava]|uniref:protein TBATA-like n=1 Tax=Styela clava TaxID=7725 RepID=UPI00193ABB46|nr:protein TBATA-like [Styela clava]